jgi:hypothetical protein
VGGGVMRQVMRQEMMRQELMRKENNARATPASSRMAGPCREADTARIVL